MRFWNWTDKEDGSRNLDISGVIAEESWWGDEVTPMAFREELEAGEGDITVWINSCGGDVFAASEIYTMLKDYKGKVTVKISALAASAASVIAMAGDEVLMSPTAMLMIHNPATMAYGDAKEMKHTIEVLDGVKESIINAYELKTGLSRVEISHLMDNETWLDARTAIQKGFCDGYIERLVIEPPQNEEDSKKVVAFSARSAIVALAKKVNAQDIKNTGRSVTTLRKKLALSQKI